MKLRKYFYQVFLIFVCKLFCTNIYFTSGHALFKFDKSVEQTNFFLMEGLRFNFKCPVPSSISSKNLNISWLHNNQLIDRHSLVLSLPAISKIDAGIYRCVVQNSIGSILSPAFNLTVIYLEGFADELPSFYDIKVQRNKFVVLKPPRLVGKGLVDVKWKWFFESIEVISDDAAFITKYGELVLLEVRDRYGKYHVEAISEAGNAYSKNYKLYEDYLNFPYEPQFGIIYPPHSLQINSQPELNLPSSLSTATFECVPTNWGTRPYEILWFLNNERLNESVYVRLEQSNRRLVISNVGEFFDLDRRNSHLAVIRCLAKTTDRLFQDYADANFEIFEKPKIEKIGSDDEAEITQSVGGFARFSCNEKRAWPRSKIFWYFNGAKLSNASSNTHKIENIRQNDFGVYQCEAVNMIGADIAQFWLRNGEHLLLQNRNRVKIVNAPVDLSVKPGSDIVLPCRTKDLKDVVVTWKLNGTDLNLSDNRIVINSDSLTVKNAKVTDSGTYKCEAESKDGISTDAATANVLVLGSNLIQYGPSNQSVLIGSNIQMPCKLSDEYLKRNDVVVAWFRNNQEIPSSGDLSHRISFNNDGSLLIYQVGPENIGLYSCVARTSDSESESATAWLRLIEKPSMPQNVSVLLINDTLPNKIRISWKLGFDGNSPITKHVVEMRTIGTNGLWSDWESVIDNIPSELCCSIVVDSVKPSEEAAFRVIASNRHGAGKPSLSSRNIKIPQQPPADAPRQVAASARSSSSVMVQWQPPPAAQWNGEIKGYMIRYRLSGYATADWNEKNVSNVHARNALIEPLITWREYDIQVAAYNDRGLGVYSKPIEVTTLEGVPIQAPQNVKIDVINSTSIQISFEPPDQQMVPGVNLGYKIDFWKSGYWPKLPKLIPYKTIRVIPEFSRISQRVDNLEKFGHYNVTVLCFTAPGDGPRSDPIEVVTLEDVPGPPSSISFDEVLYNSVLLKWKPPYEPNGIILKYIIRHWKFGDNEKHTVEVSAYENSLLIYDLTPSTNYSLDIQAVTKVGGGLKVEASFESKVTPEMPDRPSSLSVSDIGPRSVVLEFIPGFDGHSFIKNWIVEAKIGSNSIFSVIFNTSLPKARSFIVTNLRPYTRYQLRLIAENVRGRSAPSDPTRSFQTKQTFPENSPEKVYAEPISSRQLQISWTPLLAGHWNGDPMGYLVFTRIVLNTNFSDKQAEWIEHMVFNTKASDLLISDLIPFTSYQVKVCAKNAFGNSNFSVVTVATTYESAPSAAPLNVFAEWSKKQVLVFVKWSEVAAIHRNGRILGYILRFVPENEELRRLHSKELEIFGADVFFAEMTQLKPFTSYRVFVSAFNLVGEGPSNAEPLFGTTSESLPGKPSNVSFTYKSTTEVRLSWQTPVEANGQVVGYSIRYWRADQSEEDAVNTQIPYNVKIFSATSLTSETIYHFAIKAENVLGWGAERLLDVKTTSRNAPLPVPSILSRNVLRPQYSDKIYLSWSVSSEDQGRLSTDISPIRAIQLEYRNNVQKFGKDEEHFWEKWPLTLDPDTDELLLTNLVSNTAYKARIRFIGDFLQSSWSYESDWIKTAESLPTMPPDIVQVIPYESFSALVKWRALEQNMWNSDIIGYRILYRIYPSDDVFNVEDVSNPQLVETDGVYENKSNQIFQHVLTKLSSFRHYVVQIKSVNAIGASKPSKPKFVYVGYSVPKQLICNLAAESLTSTSIRLSWDKSASPAFAEKNDEGGSISGYKIRYTPISAAQSLNNLIDLTSTVDNLEEVVTTNKNEYTLIDLRKFTDYKIIVAAYNRAGEGQSTVIQIKTLEDIPGSVGPLVFQDILLNSVNVSWALPLQPNGVIQGYVVNYLTYKMAEEFRKEIQEKTQLTYLLADNLEENVTYHFYVRAETSAGLGAEASGNVTIGYNEGAPLAIEKPSVIFEHSTFLLMWKLNNLERLPIKGHLIQAKRTATMQTFDNFSLSVLPKNNVVPLTGKYKMSRDTIFDYITFVNDSNRRAVPISNALTTNRIDTDEFRPRHPIGEWFTLSSVLGPQNEYRISYRQLEPSTYYVFRLFARNKIGVGLPSAESNQLFVPALLPDDPFWNQWWFLVIVGLVIVLVIVIFVATLCCTNNAKSLCKTDKNDAFDTLQLSDGGIVSYELYSKHLKRAEELSRPNTHTSWVSAGGGVPLRFDNILDNSNNIGVYGSIASEMVGSGVGAPAVSSMYQALTTDALPPDVIKSSKTGNYFGNFDNNTDLFLGNNFGGGAGNEAHKLSRCDFDNLHTNNGYESNRNSNASPSPFFGLNLNSNYHLKDFNAASKFQSKNKNTYNGIENSADNLSMSLPTEETFASHYQSNDEAKRTTWRRTRQQAAAQQQNMQHKKIGFLKKDALKRPASTHQPINLGEGENFNSSGVTNIHSSASYTCLNQMGSAPNKSEAIQPLVLPFNNEHDIDKNDGDPYNIQKFNYEMRTGDFITNNRVDSAQKTSTNFDTMLNGYKDMKPASGGQQRTYNSGAALSSFV